MKISNNLLQSIMVGVGMTAMTTSCGFLDNTDDIRPHLDDKETVCTENGCHEKGEITHYDCPACGMG